MRSAIRRSEATRRSTSARRGALRACIARASSLTEVGGSVVGVGCVATMSFRLEVIGDGVETLGDDEHDVGELVELAL
jgi:hypothetical protein